MLDFRQVGGRTDLRQYCRPPAVYLDHWAFRRFSDKPGLRTELVSAIAERNGTLAIGRLNLLEFTRVEYPEQVQAAEELVQAVLPRVFFLDIQIMDVVQRENARGFGACGDTQMFEYYGRPLLDDTHRWRAIRLFNLLADQKADFRAGFGEIERKVLATLNEYRGLDRRTVREALEEARRRRCATLGLAQALIDEVFRDKQRALDLGDATDMLHAVVPCAYCDFVLLDGEWCDYVERARLRLNKAGARQHIALVFHGRGDGLRRFLDALRSHPGDPRGASPWPE